MYNSKQIDFSHYLLFSIQQLPITNNRLVNSAYQLNKNIQKLNMFEYGISEINLSTSIILNHVCRMTQKGA